MNPLEMPVKIKLRFSGLKPTWIETNQTSLAVLKNGRGGEIRTHDLLYPKQARYQPTLRPDTGKKILPAKNPSGNILIGDFG